MVFSDRQAVAVSPLLQPREWQYPLCCNPQSGNIPSLTDRHLQFPLCIYSIFFSSNRETATLWVIAEGNCLSVCQRGCYHFLGYSRGDTTTFWAAAGGIRPRYGLQQMGYCHSVGKTEGIYLYIYISLSIYIAEYIYINISLRGLLGRKNFFRQSLCIYSIYEYNYISIYIYIFI